MDITSIFRRKKKNELLDLGGGAQLPGGPGDYGPAAGFPGQQGFPPVPAFPPQGAPMDMGMGGLPGMPPQQFQQPAPSVSSDQIENLRRSIESVNYKLDALKAAMDSINARLANIEIALKASPTEKQEGWSTF